MVSLCILNINNIDKKVFEKKEFTLQKVSTLENFGFEINNTSLGLPKTVIRKKFVEGDYIYYSVSMNSRTITEPIYVYWDEMEERGFKELNKGYQRILNFNFRIDKDYKTLFIFAQKDIAYLFLSRLKREGIIDCKCLKFDFSKIMEVKNVDSAWGVWEDHNGIERKRARFGKGINEILEENELKSATTFYIDYNYAGQIIQPILSVNGRISILSKDISEADIIVITNEIVSVLCS